MSIRVAVVFAVVMAGGVARADAPKEALALFEAGKYSEALRAGKQAVEAQPSSPAAHYAYGVILRNVYRRGEAVKELERAHQLAPGDVTVAVQLGWVLAELGEFERARAVVVEAARRSPDEVGELQAWLEREQRLRAGPKAALSAGSAPEFVARVMGKLERHQVKDVLRHDVDPAVLDRWAADFGARGDTASEEFVSGLAEGIEEALAARSTGASLRGYEVMPQAAQRSGVTVVSVGLLMDSRATPAQIKMFEKALADPTLPVPMDPTLAAVLRALEPADRRASLDGLASHAVASDLSLEFELSGGSGAWRIADVVEKDSGFRVSGLVGMMRTLGDRGVVDIPRPRKRSSAYEMGYAVGRLLGPIAVIAIIVALVMRRRRRREP